MSSETTVGREPVQLLEIKQPLCGNVYGVAPCTASGAVGSECYNTRPTCQDPDNYRHTPEFLLTPSSLFSSGDTIAVGDIDRANDLFAAADVFIPSAPDGIIWEQGSTGVGSYLGFTSGLLVWRTGNGGTLPQNDASRIAVDVSQFYNKEVTIYIEWVDSTSVNNLWIWDELDRTLTFMGTDTPVAGFADWTGTDDGGVGTSAGSGVTTGESLDDYNGEIHELRVFDNLLAPNMTNPFVVPLFFSGGHVGDQVVSGADYIFPSLKSVGTQPTKINLSSANANATGLGNRAVMTTDFRDHPHTDRVVDPYVETRLFDPFERGSFWSKWFVRNTFRFNMLGLVHEGYVGQSVIEMTSRSYILTNTAGPSETGGVTIQWKDVLAKIEERKAQVPVASNGLLVAAINTVVLALSVAGATEGEYDASGTLRIGDELMTYSGFVVNGSNLDFTLTERGSDNTDTEEHDPDDTVQLCLRFTSQAINTITEDLLVNGGGVSRGFVDINGTFKSETEDFLAAYILSAVITEPTSVATLLSEIQEQVGFYIWWHERDQIIKMAAVRGITAEPDLFTDADNILEKSFSLADIPRNRISQVWFSYGLNSPTESLTDVSSFKQTLIQADLPSEGPSQYGEKSVRKIFSRWITQDSLALSTSSKIITRYSKAPRMCNFKADAKDRAKWVGDTIRISHFLDVDETGMRKIANWTIVSAEEVVPGETIQYAAEDTTLYGIISQIQANGTPDYQGDGTDSFTGAFIGDNDGLLSDGTSSARIN